MIATQLNIARDDAMTDTRFPIRLLTVAYFLTIMAFAGFGWIISDARRDAKALRGQLRAEEQRGVVVHLDEVMTMSARMAAATGDSRWEERYRHFEPQLDAAIKEATKTETNPSNIKAATKTDAANVKLVEMENRAFALVRAGRKEEARAVLFSPEYEAQKQIYAEGIASLTSQIRRALEEHLRDNQLVDWLILIVALAVSGISIVAWISAARGMEGWHAKLLDSVQQRAEAEGNLRKVHADLEVRVKERTADLAETNQTLQAEISERQRAEWQLNIQYAISRVLMESSTLKDASARILQTVCENLNWKVGEFYTVDRRAGVMQFDDMWSAPNAQVDAFVEFSRQTTFVRGIGLPGRVWATGKPAWIRDVAVDENFPRASAAKQVGLHGAFCFPILSGNEVSGVIEFFSHEIRQPDEELLRVFAGVGSQLGQFFERKRAETGLQRSEAHTKAIVQSSLDCIITIDHQGKIREFNPAAELTFRYPRARVLGMELAEVIIPPSLRERHRRGMTHYLATGEAKVLGKRIEIVAMRSDGSEFPVELTITRLDAEGPPMFTGFIRDITERKQSDLNSIRLAAIVESSDEAIIGKDLNGIVTNWNKGAEKIFGYTAGEMEGTSITRLIPPDRWEDEQHILSKVGCGESVTHFDTVRQTKKGQLIDVSITASPIKDATGKVIGVSKLARDITERKRAEAQRERLADIVEASPDFIGIAEPKTAQVQYINKHGRTMCGIGEDENVGKLKISDMHPAWMNKRLAEVILPAAVRDGLWQGEGAFLHRNGREIPVSMSLVARKTANGEVDVFFTVSRDITDRKQAEEVMRASEERYRSLFESNPNPMWVYDIETLSFLAVNATAVEHYGYSQDEFLAMTLKDIRPAEDIPALMDDLSERTGGSEDSTQWRHCRKDRTMIDVEIASQELSWLGRPARLVLINDVTERRKAEETLREQAALFDQTYDAVLVWDAEGVITFWNRGAENLYGFLAAEAVGRTPQELLHTEIALGLQTVIQSLARHGMWEGEVEHTTSAGRRITVESRMVLVHDPKREYVLAINRDITERKRGEERLLEQADIINRAHDAVVIQNFENGEITFWNMGAEGLYGWNASETLGKPIGELSLADPKDREATREMLASTGEFRGELKQRAKDGREIVVESHATLIRNPDGKPRSVLLINTDVTEQKKLQTQLLRSQRLESIGTLASGVAHDLNNILTPILICVEVLRKNPDEADATASIALIEESAKRGANVVKQVLTFARGIEGERVVIKPIHLIQEMIDIAQMTFPKTIEIMSRYPEDLWSIKCDPTQLHQVLLNLSVNARDAMPNGGSLTLAAENFTVDENYAAMTPGATIGSYVMVRVSDSGVGMPRATVDKIFDPFFTTKEVGKGTGLGLSTALGIVKSHGGFISVHSKPGKGTVFEIFLPATMSDGELQKSTSVGAPIQGNGEQILIVDDEPNILLSTKMIFEKHNYRVVSANDGPEALALFAQHMDSIGGVLTDMSLPYMDGVAVVRALRKMKSDIPIIASSGQGDQAGFAELQSLGVKNFLTKPYNTQTLLTTVRETLNGTPGNPV